MDAYPVEFGDITFKASYFEFEQAHTADAKGMPGRVATAIHLTLWVRSDDPAAIDNDTRIKLFERSNFGHGGDHTEPQALTIEVPLGQEGGSEDKHKFVVNHAWIARFEEAQHLWREAGRVTVEFQEVLPGQQKREHFPVEAGGIQGELRMMIAFRGFIKEDGDAVVEAA